MTTFEGTDEEYEIATRGIHQSGYIDDNGFGFSIVEWWKDGYEYKVFYHYGYPHHIEKFGVSSRTIAAWEIMHS